MEREIAIPVIVGGGIVTEEDSESLISQGVGATFGPGATEDEIVGTVRALLR